MKTQRSLGLELDTRQPRLTMEADVHPGTKTRKRAEDAAADRVIGGDNCFALVDPDPICLIRFGDDSTEPWSTKALRHQSGVYHS